MEKKQKRGNPLWRVTFSAMWRRKKVSLLLILVAAVSVFFAVFVQNLTKRQEAAIETMIRDTAIQCVVTDAKGANVDYLQMPNGFVDRLMGLRHEQGCYLDESVKNVRAKSSMRLIIPKDATLRRILNFASDMALSPAEGAQVQMLDGWTEEAFLTEQKVCLIPEGMQTQTEEDGNEYVTVTVEDHVELKLQVIGVVSGGTANAVWCPFYLRRFENLSELVWVESCSFDIADNTRIEECKADIYETFIEPNLANDNDWTTFGVLVQEETYQNTLRELRSNLSMLRLLLPVLTALCVGIGFLAGYLTTRGRMREFAVMRCLGMRRRTIFIQTFGEYVLLSAVGAMIGGAAGLAVERSIFGSALLNGGLMLAFFLAGTAVSVWNVTRVNVMKLMKVEE